MLQQPLTREIHSITFASRDPEELAGFYQRAFNFPAAKRVGKDHLTIPVGNMELGFDKIKEKGSNGPAGPVIWFMVENVEAAFAHLISTGARVRSDVTKNQESAKALAVFYDPEDNLFGIIGPSVPGGKMG